MGFDTSDQAQINNLINAVVTQTNTLNNPLTNMSNNINGVSQIDGPQGPTGATGAAGPQGIQGIAGSNGSNGLNGALPVATVSLQNQTNALGPNTLYATPSGYHLWRVSVYFCVTSGGSSYPPTFYLNYTDDDTTRSTIPVYGQQGVGSTQNGALSSNINATSDNIFTGQLIIETNGTQNIQWSVGYSGQRSTTDRYSIYVALEQLI